MKMLEKSETLNQDINKRSELGLRTGTEGVFNKAKGPVRQSAVSYRFFFGTLTIYCCTGHFETQMGIISRRCTSGV